MEHPPATRRQSVQLNVLFSMLQCFFWSANCIYFSFLVMFLNANGYPHKTIGFLMMLLAVLNTFVPAIAGYLADFFIPIKKIVVGCLFLSIPAAFLLPAAVSVVPLTFVAVCCMSVLEKSLSSVIDSWEMRVQQHKSYLNYGLTRGSASLAFALVGIVFGNVFARTGLGAMFTVHAIFAGIALLAAVFLDAVPVQHPKADRRFCASDCAKAQPAAPQKSSYFNVVRELLRDRRYRLLLISLMCYGTSTVAIHTFQPLLITEIGGTSADLGTCLFVMAVSEVPMMILFQRMVRKVGSGKLLRLAFFCTILRVGICAVVPSIGWLIAAQLIHALAFGLYLPAALRYISDITPSKVKATAITLAMACADGLSGVIANPLGGLVSDALGIRSVFLMLACIAAIGFLVFCLSFRAPAGQDSPLSPQNQA